MQETRVRFLGQKETLENALATQSCILGLPWWLNGKESACNTEDLGSTPGLGRSPGGGHGNPLQYSCLENPHREAWRATVYGVTTNQTHLSDLSIALLLGEGESRVGDI